MMQRHVLIVGVLLWPVAAEAGWVDEGWSGTKGPKSQRVVLHPVEEGLLPLPQLVLSNEVATLATRVSTFFSFSRHALAGKGDVSAIGLGIDSRYSWRDTFELGALFPIVLSQWPVGLGQSAQDTSFGNIVLMLKGKFFETKDRQLALVGYGTSSLPTVSTAGADRGSVWTRFGLALSASVKAFSLGCNTGLALSLGSEDTVALYELSMFGALPLKHYFALQLTAQLGLPLAPDVDEPMIAATPAMQFFVGRGLHFDLGLRVAVTRSGKAYTGGGRFGAITGVGYRF